MTDKLQADHRKQRGRTSPNRFLREGWIIVDDSSSLSNIFETKEEAEAFSLPSDKKIIHIAWTEIPEPPKSDDIFEGAEFGDPYLFGDEVVYFLEKIQMKLDDGSRQLYKVGKNVHVNYSDGTSKDFFEIANALPDGTVHLWSNDTNSDMATIKLKRF